MRKRDASMSRIFLGGYGASDLSKHCLAGRESDPNRDGNCESRERSQKTSTRRHVSSPFQSNLPGNGSLQVIPFSPSRGRYRRGHRLRSTSRLSNLPGLEQSWPSPTISREGVHLVPTSFTHHRYVVFSVDWPLLPRAEPVRFSRQQQRPKPRLGLVLALEIGRREGQCWEARTAGN